VDERSELASKFLDSLRSEPYIIAEDLGTDILFSNDNIPKVVEAVRERLFPLAEQESKELYRLGEDVGSGSFSSWTRPQSSERLMVMTSMGSSTATKDAENALIKMHSRIHTLERRAPDLFETYQDDAEEGAAYVADEEEHDDWVYHGDEGPVDEAYDDTNLVAQTADASLRDVELDVFTSFLCSAGFDENDRESLAFMADVVQSETVAFMARSKAKGKGKPVNAHGAHGYRPRATGLT
ncbi:GIP, partial [Symbiodinium microadriaticum]